MFPRSRNSLADEHSERNASRHGTDKRSRSSKRASTKKQHQSTDIVHGILNDDCIGAGEGSGVTSSSSSGKGVENVASKQTGSENPTSSALGIYSGAETIPRNLDQETFEKSQEATNEDDVGTGKHTTITTTCTTTNTGVETGSSISCGRQEALRVKSPGQNDPIGSSSEAYGYKEGRGNEEEEEEEEDGEEEENWFCPLCVSRRLQLYVRSCAPCCHPLQSTSSVVTIILIRPAAIVW